MGRRLAESGYSVLTVNPFYRVQKAPTAPEKPNFQDPATRDALMKLAGGLSAETNVTDAKAFVRVARQPGVRRQEEQDRHHRLLHGRPAHHAHGRDAAGSHRRRRLVPRRQPRHRQAGQPASAHPEDEGAAICSRSRRTTTSVTRSRRTVLKEEFAKAKLPAEIEVYKRAMHGWCPPDSQAYNQAQAEKAWTRLLALFKTALV